ncbi:hypothetical protein [Haematobacter massiliensis]|uniref:hypothetical protein n=1 Tax=Haematobacter massiliensis TaxID=195105 RepID=UPI0020CC6E5B|nr:hypothetical protein [Haematobacter massiliensis]
MTLVAVRSLAMGRAMACRCVTRRSVARRSVVVRAMIVICPMVVLSRVRVVVLAMRLAGRAVQWLPAKLRCGGAGAAPAGVIGYCSVGSAILSGHWFGLSSGRASRVRRGREASRAVIRAAQGTGSRAQT